MLKDFEAVSYIENITGHGGFDPNPIDKNTEDAIIRLFEILSVVPPTYSDDEYRSYWIRTETPSFEEFMTICYVEDEEDIRGAKDEYDYRYAEEKWIHIVTKHFKRKGDDEFYGIILNGKYTFGIDHARPTERYGEDYTDLIEWLSVKLNIIINDIKNGTYHSAVERDLPYIYREGQVRRKDLYDACPELREALHESIGKENIQKFLVDTDDYSPDNAITARKYFEACLAGYRGVGKYKTETGYSFKELHESDYEHKRYGGITPREVYVLNSDGRDDGLSRVPLDSPEELRLWMDRKGDFFEFNGHHPYELMPAMSCSESLHMYIGEDCFEVGCTSYGGCGDAVRFYLGVKDAGFPVILIQKELVKRRIQETDDVRIRPVHAGWFGIGYDYNGSDAIGIDILEEEKDRLRTLMDKIRWDPVE